MSIYNTNSVKHGFLKIIFCKKQQACVWRAIKMLSQSEIIYTLSGIIAHLLPFALKCQRSAQLDKEGAMIAHTK